MKNKKPLLTISLLISNRPDTIPRCLDSLHLIMDKLPCELILIDTSKSEEIHNMLLTYTDKVYEFEWCKDFAKARNEGVRRAKGEWFLYLDDDEWFVDVDDIIDFFISKRYKKEQCANIKIKNFLDLEYTVYTESMATRLFYLGDGAKFEGKVHEYIHPIYAEPIFLQSYANHSGYVFETPEEKRKHYERNVELLLDVLEEEPTNLRWVSQLIQEYRAEHNWEDTITLCKKYLKDLPELTHYMQRNHFCTMYAGLVEALINTKKHKKALEICEIAFEDERSTDLLKSLLHLYAATAYIELKNWEQAYRHIEQYFEGYEYFKQNKEDMNEQLGALMVHRVFENDYLEKASNILVYLELKKENIDVPFVEGEEEKQVQIDVLSGQKFVKAMIKLLGTRDYMKAFDYFLQNIEKNEKLCQWACAETQQWEETDWEGFQKIVYAFSKIENDFWYIQYCKVIYADICEDQLQVEKEIEALLELLDCVFFMPEKIYGIVEKYNITVAFLWDKIAGEHWETQVKRLVNECEDIYIDKAYDYILAAYEEHDWHAQSVVSALEQKMVLQQQREEMNLLRTQIIDQVKGMIATEKYDMAIQFLKQLKVMFPEDEEVITLEKQLEGKR